MISRIIRGRHFDISSIASRSDADFSLIASTLSWRSSMALWITRVTGTKFGVAALEISEALDVLAGAIAEDSDLESPSVNHNSSIHIPAGKFHFIFTTYSTERPFHATLHQGRNTPSLPSLLRMEHGPPMPSIYSSSELKTDSRTMPAVPTVKRGVRFAEDDQEDQIPLGYVLRIKKKHEERARFLQEEKERRAFEEERARQEEERLRREAERREWEKEKKAWEKEKKAMEEERRQRQHTHTRNPTATTRSGSESEVDEGYEPEGLECEGDEDEGYEHGSSMTSRKIYSSRNTKLPTASPLHVFEWTHSIPSNMSTVLKHT